MSSSQQRTLETLDIRNFLRQCKFFCLSGYMLYDTVYRLNCKFNTCENWKSGLGCASLKDEDINCDPVFKKINIQ